MAARHSRVATYDDIVRLPENMVGEIIDGDLYAWPRPSPLHGDAFSIFLGRLINPYRLGEGGPGGWWIIGEPEVHFGRDVLVPDIGGWRRERLPALPENPPHFTISPDWVCEVLSPSTARVDRTKKMRIYGENDVAFLWIIDPQQRTLETYQLLNAQWVLLRTYAGNDAVRAEPFPAAEIHLASIWGETPDDFSPLPAP
jgi:Uma2 family endonuclease